jgi:predicted nuclease of predicted toxin-antitoxin system
LKARKRWRLYADNNIEKEIIGFLREEEFDVLAVGKDAQLRHQEDEFHYQKARQLDRYLVTHDGDFGMTGVSRCASPPASSSSRKMRTATPNISPCCCGKSSSRITTWTTGRAISAASNSASHGMA